MRPSLAKKVSIITGKTALSLSLLLNVGWTRREEPQKLSNPVLEEIIDYQQDYKVILPFKTPETITEKFVFENNDTIKYMNWVRAKSSWKLARALKNVIDSPGPSGFKGLYDILVKERELTQYVPLKDIAKYNSSKPSFQGTTDPTRPSPKPVFYQKDRLGRLIKVRTTSFEGIVLENILKNPDYFAKEFFDGMKNGDISQIEENTNEQFRKELLRGSQSKKELSEKMKENVEDIVFQRIYASNVGLKYDEPSFVNFITQGKNYKNDDFAKVDIMVKNRCFDSMLEIYLLRNNNEWDAYMMDNNSEIFEAKAKSNMISTSKNGNDGKIYAYPGYPQHKGKLYGVTKGLPTPNRTPPGKPYEYEFLEYSDGEWHSLIRFNEKRKLSPDEIGYIGERYDFNQKAYPHVLGNLLMKVSLWNN